jgi:succinoglycan biosynthesis transport protein ExoP
MSNRPASNLLGPVNAGGAPARGAMPFDLKEWVEIPLRHPFHVVVPFVLVVTAAVSATFLLPKKYQSNTLILIESSRVPDRIAPNLSSESANRRLQAIRQEILSRTRLERVNAELNPYPKVASPNDAVERMRTSIEVAFKGDDAFSIDYTHQDPHMAQRVTARLATLFTEESQKSRQEEMEGASAFLDGELQAARKQLDDKEESLRRYKEQHMGRLPEQMSANLATLQRLQLEQQSLDQTIRSAEERVDRLEASRSGPEGVRDSPAPLEAEITRLRNQLASLRTKYTDEHPDVKAVQAQLEVLTRSAAATPGSTAAVSDGASRGQAERARAELRTLIVRRDDLRKQVDMFQARVEQAPRAEQDMATLTRDFNQLRDNYYELLRKKTDVQRAERLQQRWRDAFRILDEANLPERPVFPNRSLFISLGILLGLGLGLGAAFGQEVLLDTSVKTVHDLETTLPHPVVGRIPHVGHADLRKMAAQMHQASAALKPGARGR